MNLQLNHIANDDTRKWIKTLPDNCIDVVVTSPPYYFKRDYGTGKWEGGSDDCNHRPDNTPMKRDADSSTLDGSKSHSGHKHEGFKTTCIKCGAVRIDKQMGMENTPEQYIKEMVALFMEVFRVLKPTGLLFLNIGDSYWGGKGQSGSENADKAWERTSWGKAITRKSQNLGGMGVIRGTDAKHKTIKRKDLVGITWTLALALRDAGWVLRQDIIWRKPSPMPESILDRCTVQHEYIFMFSKNSKKNLLWRARDTREWAWSKPDLSETCIGRDGKLRDRWQGFDYYFDADAIATVLKNRGAQKYIERMERRQQIADEREANGEVEPVDIFAGIYPGKAVRSGADGGNQGNNKGIPYVPMAAAGNGNIFNKTGSNIKTIPTANRRSVWDSDNSSIWNWLFDNNDRALIQPMYDEWLRQSGFKGDVWNISPEQFRKAHFAVFPQELAELCIKAGCPRGGIVADPFTGSGTTPLVAKKLGLDYVGCELNPDYLAIKDMRFEEEFGMFNPNNR